jgi:hypothetical protein
VIDQAAVDYYAAQRYAGPSLLALHGLRYYTDSPAVRAIMSGGGSPQYTYSAGTFRGRVSGIVYDHFDYQGEDGVYWGGNVNGSYEPLEVAQAPGSVLNWYYDPAADVSWIPLREGESLSFIDPGDGINLAKWVLRSPAERDTTRGLTWSDVRAGIEYVGVALGLAYVGGELLAPEAGAVGEISLPTAAEAIQAPEVIDIFGTLAGATEPAIDAAAFTAGDVAVAGSAAGTGAATIPADVGIAAPAAAAAVPAAAPSIPAALSNAVQSLANSSLVTAIQGAVAPAKPRPAPIQPAAAPAPGLPLPLLILGGIAVKVLFFS